ncbi:MAG: LPD29 domain-containing protein [Dehalococcoidales bacterium]|nr:LPD29 domain-containing protein [Dehalococcoidales bacterium]
MPKEYLSCAETAKLVRATLKKQFPGVKFTVRSSTYSMGASISIGWLLGPTTKEVDQAVGGFEGASFDGMNDLQSNQDSWLLPDGSAQLAYRPDSYGGSVPGFVSDAPHPSAKMVSFGADYIHTNRRYAETWQGELSFREQVSRDLCVLQRVPYTGENTVGLFGSGDSEQASHHAWRLLNFTSFAPGESYAGVRYTKEDEDNGDARIPMAIVKQMASAVPV